jgi:hypothetical protein
MKVWLTPGTKHVGIPYVAKQRASGAQNYGYFDLKQHPKLIGKIPELEGIPELQHLVVMLNRPESVFQTLGCEKAFAESDMRGYRRRLTSYFDIVFSFLDWNLQEGNFRGLYQAFEEFAGSKGDLPNSYGVEFETGVATFNDHNSIKGFQVGIWNFGYGETDKDAHREWAKGVAIVHEFFVKQNAAHPSGRYRSLKTVSRNDVK